MSADASPMRRTLVIVGLGLFALGAFFLLQALGYVRWPADSFMIGAPAWRLYGSILAVTGLVMVIVGRRMRR